MNRPPIVIQDIFLNQVRKENVKVVVELTSGSTIAGYIKGFDSFVIILDHQGGQVMMYKHAVACIHPERTVFYSTAPGRVPMDRPMDRSMDRPIDRSMDRPMDRSMDRPMDRPLDRL